MPNLSAYWSAPEVATNMIVFFNLFGALILGLIVGYERSYHGRAAGMRTYGLVCMAAAALTVIAGYPAYWFGGQVNTYLAGDPTRVIQGIVTGIGFLGAGVIMRDGLNISGLTTAASIWTCSAIGIMVGVGFYASAIMLTAPFRIVMMWISKLESWLPSRPAIAVTLDFQKNFVPPGTHPARSRLLARLRDRLRLLRHPFQQRKTGMAFRRHRPQQEQRCGDERTGQRAEHPAGRGRLLALACEELSDRMTSI